MPADMCDALKAAGDEFHELWRNNIYEVMVRFMDPAAGRAGPVHLSIKRLDREPAADWRHKQSIKNEIVGPMREAVELFPAESRLVDSANQTHLWVGPEGHELSVGFREYAAFDQETAVKLAIDKGYPADIVAHGKQRRWQEGISTGPDYARRMGWEIVDPS